MIVNTTLGSQRVAFKIYSSIYMTEGGSDGIEMGGNKYPDYDDGEIFSEFHDIEDLDGLINGLNVEHTGILENFPFESGVDGEYATNLEVIDNKIRYAEYLNARRAHMLSYKDNGETVTIKNGNGASVEVHRIVSTNNTPMLNILRRSSPYSLNNLFTKDGNIDKRKTN